MRKTICSILVCVILFLPKIAEADMYYYHQDYLGGASVVTDEEGDVAAVYEYMPYGEVYTSTVYDDNFSSSYLFTDQEKDSETDLYYYGARYYDAGIGKFMSQDPAVYDSRLFPSDENGDGIYENPGLIQDPQMLNAYAYARNNPVKYTDPNGEEIDTEDIRDTMKALLVGYYAKTLNLATTSLLWHSLQDNPSSKSFGNGSYIANMVMGSDEYNALLSSLISDAEANGDTTFTFSEKDKKGIKFSSGDLGTAIAGTKSTKITGQKNNNGDWEIKTEIFDIYDFDLKGYNDPAISAINNMATVAEEMGVINSYGVTIKFTDTIENNDN